MWCARVCVCARGCAPPTWHDPGHDPPLLALCCAQGVVTRHPRASIALFQQQHVSALPLDETPAAYLVQQYPQLSELDARMHLGAFGIVGGLAKQSMGTLSGGQRARVVLASITLLRPQLLILDEPSNHLDYQSIEALAEAFKRFGGALVVVSHDQFLLESVVQCEGGQLWVVGGGTVVRWGGSVGEYIESELEAVRRAMRREERAAARHLAAAGL